MFFVFLFLFHFGWKTHIHPYLFLLELFLTLKSYSEVKIQTKKTKRPSEDLNVFTVRQPELLADK